jgi:hypothetical protein
MKVKLDKIEKFSDSSVDPAAINFLVAMGFIKAGSDMDEYDYVLTDKCEKKNWAICKRCNTFMLSEHVHDFVRCNCPNDDYIFIDGGDDYCRMGGEPEQFYKR